MAVSIERGHIIQSANKADITIDEQEPLTWENYYRPERNRYTIRYKGQAVWRAELSEILVVYGVLLAGTDPGKITEEYIKSVKRESIKIYLGGK